MTASLARYDRVPPWRPDEEAVPPSCREAVRDLFDTWEAVRARDARLTRYYEMKASVRDFGVSIPPQLARVDEVVGWAAKAVDVRAARSQFDGFVFEGAADEGLDALVRDNRLRGLARMATRSMLVHGCAAMTVMRGGPGQPAAKVRAFSANQCAMLWDKDADALGAGVALTGVDRRGAASAYVVHLPDRVLSLRRPGVEAGWELAGDEPNRVGSILMVPLVNDPDLDRPLGRSVLTPELLSIVDKAMRDVLRMDVGAEFFTAPQRYILGASPALLGRPKVGEDGEPVVDEETGRPAYEPDPAKALRAYLGSLWAFTKDEDGDLPQVGQFPAGSAGNFVSVFENDAQRFSSASNVPLGQLGVLSNNYTSSDALGAANDPLILDVQGINDGLRGPLRQVARLMMAVGSDKPLDRLTGEQDGVAAYFRDPATPTLAASADAWTKVGAADPSIVGTRVWYERMGIDQATIDRIMGEKRRARGDSTLAEIAATLGGADDTQGAVPSLRQGALSDGPGGGPAAG